MSPGGKLFPKENSCLLLVTVCKFFQGSIELRKFLALQAIPNSAEEHVCSSRALQIGNDSLQFNIMGNFFLKSIELKKFSALKASLLINLSQLKYESHYVQEVLLCNSVCG